MFHSLVKGLQTEQNVLFARQTQCGWFFVPLQTTSFHSIQGREKGFLRHGVKLHRLSVTFTVWSVKKD